MEALQEKKNVYCNKKIVAINNLRVIAIVDAMCYNKFWGIMFVQQKISLQ